MSFKSMMAYRADKLAMKRALDAKLIGVCDLHADMTGLRPCYVPGPREMRCQYCKAWATMVVDENTPANEIYDD